MTFMRTNSFVRQIASPVGAVALAITVSACNLETQQVPAVSAPSEFGLAITVAALPDQLPRDGASQATVSVTARGPQGQPLANQRIGLAFVSPSAPGAALSSNEVTTAADGHAVFTVTAPPSTMPGDNLRVSLTPVGSNFDNTAARTVALVLMPSNPSAPNGTISYTPTSPALNENVGFDASGSTDEGALCYDVCTYAWDFGDGSTASGRTATHSYSASGPRSVTLTTHDAAGAVAVTTRTVTVAAPTAPVASITMSPSSATRGATMYFDGGGSTVGVGATIVEYAWTWGDGSSNTVGTSAQASHSFSNTGTYVVRLTIRDSLGRTATVTYSCDVS
jgi:PKD repeat protein